MKKITCYKSVNGKVFAKKEEAIKSAENFLKELTKLEKKYSLCLNSDTGDIYLSFRRVKTIDNLAEFDNVSIGWKGDGTGLIVTEKTKEDYRREALSKLSEEEKEALGVKE